MLSTDHHYDDVVAPLLFAALAGILPDLWQDRLAHRSLRRQTACVTLGIMLMMFFAGISPLRDTARHVPTSNDFEVLKELKQLQKEFPDAFLYAQNSLGPYINRYAQAPVPTFEKLASITPHPEGDIVVLCRKTDPWGIADINTYIEGLEQDNITFRRLTDYKHLEVFAINDL
jgi:hypothetical protein